MSHKVQTVNKAMHAALATVTDKATSLLRSSHDDPPTSLLDNAFELKAKLQDIEHQLGELTSTLVGAQVTPAAVTNSVLVCTVENNILQSLALAYAIGEQLETLRVKAGVVSNTAGDTIG